MQNDDAQPLSHASHISLKMIGLALGVMMIWPSLVWSQDTQPVPDAPEDVNDMLRGADKIAGQVARSRGLPVLGPIKKGVKNREQLRKIIGQKLDEQISTEELARDGRVLRRLGMLTPEQDYGKLVVDILSEQIAGFYDHETGELNMIEGTASGEQEIIMAHELFHAIQDQHFNLAHIQPPREGMAGSRHNEDRALARSAIIEGDATVVMLDFLYVAQGMIQAGGSLLDQPLIAAALKQQLKNMGPSMMGQSPTLDRAPAWMQQSLIFAYIGGLNFVASMRHQQSWDRMNGVYLDPPNSTEQILHPKRYLERDQPTLVGLKLDKLTEILSKSGTWTPEYNNVMGEFQLKLWLEHHLGRERQAAQRVQAAVEGWDGDRLYAIQGPNDLPLAVHISVWDSDSDALEFADALSAMTERRRPKATTSVKKGTHGGLTCFDDGAERTLVEVWGDWVVYVDGLPSTKIGKEVSPAWAPLREAIWAGRQAGPYPKIDKATPPMAKP